MSTAIWRGSLHNSSSGLGENIGIASFKTQQVSTIRIIAVLLQEYTNPYDEVQSIARD